MKISSLFGVHILAFVMLTSVGWAEESNPNLLRNGDFENAKNPLNDWKIETVNTQQPTYFYVLDQNGGGHNNGRPFNGNGAIELYNPNVRLAQEATLKPGMYRLTGRVCSLGDGAFTEQKLCVNLGAQTRKWRVEPMAYRLYYADFKVDTAGKYSITFNTDSGAMVLDDLALRPLADGTEEPPYLFLDLCPTSWRRSAGIQTYIKGQPQWVNFKITCMDAEHGGRLRQPSLRLYAPKTVRLSFNEDLLRTFAGMKPAESPVQAAEVQRNGRPHNRYSLPLPRLANDTMIQPFGGFFVEAPAGDTVKIGVELLDNGRVFPAQDITLTPVNGPQRQVTPKRLTILAYDVQHWTQSLADRLAVLPRQFAMMGFNVWSDYDCAGAIEETKPSAEEQVRARAAREFGIRNFWPNFSTLLAVSVPWKSQADAVKDPDMFLVGEDGKVDPTQYNARYAAANGRAWRESALKAFQRTMTRPTELGLPFRHNGFVTDAHEALFPSSYDATTLADFAKWSGIDRKDVSPASLRGAHAAKWLSYNMKLYTQVAINLADALRQVAPGMTMGNTASAFGPIGSASLPLPEQMEWAKSYDVTIPQWYNMHGYYPGLYDYVMQGTKAKLYGKTNGYADVIPLLVGSMEYDLNEPECLRFQALDLLSASPAVRGIGYYSGSCFFADGAFMAGLSKVNTLLADVEDYYLDGQRADELARFVSTKNIAPQRALDNDGHPATFKPEIKTSARLHIINRDGRIALLTIVSHSCRGSQIPEIGDTGLLTFDPGFKRKFVPNPAKTVIIDRLTGTVTPFSDRIQVDTTKTGNMALLEIADRTWVSQNFKATNGTP